MRYAGKCARWRARRPSAPPPGGATRMFLAAAGCAWAWPASEWARFCWHKQAGAGRDLAGIAGPVPAPPPGCGRCARAFKITAHQPVFACASTNNSPLHGRSPCRHRPADTYVRTYVYIICTHGPPEFDFQSILCMCLCPGFPAPRTTRALAACGRAGPGGSRGKIALKPRPPS